MKKKFLIALICFTGFIGASSFAGNREPQDQQDCNNGQCYAIKADGYRCKNCCQQYSNYCWSHNR